MIGQKEKRRSVLEAFLKNAPVALRDHCKSWIIGKKNWEIEQIWSDMQKKPERRNRD
jgi:hypothetical protein